MTTCKEECPNEAVAQGWCRKHYLRWYKYGDPQAKFNRWGEDRDVETKQCSQCLDDLPVDAFHKRKDNNGSDGRPMSRCKECHNQAQRDGRLVRKYGLTLEQYQELLDSQGGVCAICKEVPQGKSRAPVDHDHGTGIVRGILCHQCNVGLGHFRDDPKLLIAATDYLTNPSYASAAD